MSINTHAKYVGSQWSSELLLSSRSPPLPANASSQRAKRGLLLPVKVWGVRTIVLVNTHPRLELGFHQTSTHPRVYGRHANNGAKVLDALGI